MITLFMTDSRKTPLVTRVRPDSFLEDGVIVASAIHCDKDEEVMDW